MRECRFPRNSIAAALAAVVLAAPLPASADPATGAVVVVAAPRMVWNNVGREDGGYWSTVVGPSASVQWVPPMALVVTRIVDPAPYERPQPWLRQAP